MFQDGVPVINPHHMILSATKKVCCNHSHNKNKWRKRMSELIVLEASSQNGLHNIQMYVLFTHLTIVPLCGRVKIRNKEDDI